MQDQTWFCITTAGGCENAANDRLQACGIRTFYPRYQKIVKYFGSYPKPVAVPFFPRYLFAQCLLEDYQLAAFGQRKEVLRLLDFGSGPAIVGQEVIDFLYERFDEGGMIRPEHSPFNVQPLRAGSHIKPLEPMWEQYEGIVQRATRDRVWALLQILDERQAVPMQRLVEFPRSAVAVV